MLFAAWINCRNTSVVCFSYNLDVEEKREGVNWSDHKTLPLSEQGTLCVTGPNQVRIMSLFLPSYCMLVVLATVLRLKFLKTNVLHNIHKSCNLYDCMKKLTLYSLFVAYSILYSVAHIKSLRSFIYNAHSDFSAYCAHPSLK